MIKKVLLALALSLFASNAFAVCGAIPLTIKDAAGTTQNLSSATANDGNCKTYIDADPAGTLINAINAAVPVNKNGTATGQTGVTPGTAQTGTIVGANVDLTSINGVATPVGSGVQATAPRMTLATDSPGIITLGQTTKSASVPVTIASDQQAGTFPNAATAIQGNATGSTGAVVGTLAAAAAKTTYLCDFDVTALGTASSVGPIVIAGLLGGSKTYQMGTLATGTQQFLTKSFNPCLPGSATNTAITITTTADATATAVDVNSSGYQQ